jgi:hypothetical protein
VAQTAICRGDMALPHSWLISEPVGAPGQLLRCQTRLNTVPPVSITPAIASRTPIVSFAYRTLEVSVPHTLALMLQT